MKRMISLGFAAAAFSGLAGGTLTEAQKEELLRDTPEPHGTPLDWWGPDGLCRKANAAFEKANGLEPGGGDSGVVARVLGVLTRSGDGSITNTLNRALFATVSPWRPLLFCAAAGFAGSGVRELAERAVREISPDERKACYAEGLGRMAACGESFTRAKFQTEGLLMECAAAETDASSLAELDRGLAKWSGAWRERNLRRRVAERFSGVSGEAGAYFKKIAKVIGPPRLPAEADIRL